ncbi:globin domain-containing protein [Celeribacter arenosi]|uniref:Globin family protein n=1 Tax=Celeribacter arenosi TaxID=792649 RepID=A0ABP7K5M6_9RHOB
MPTPEQIALVRDSYKAVMATRPELVEDFYTRLFVTQPSLKPMFPQDITGQAMKTEATLQLAILSLSAPDALIGPLRDLGRYHAGVGVRDGMYHTMCEVLMDTLAAQAGPIWTPEVSQAWGKVLAFVTNTMIEGAHGDHSDEAAPLIA